MVTSVDTHPDRTGRVHFYLGTHEPSWLATAKVPLFVSHRRLARLRRSLPVAATGWALDSGGFSELSLHGRWVTTPADYVAAVRRYDTEIGRLDWAAPQDWMCEPVMIAKTGLSVAEHQRRTVANFVELSDRWADASDAESPFMPVLQGWERDDYLRCIEMYAEAGVDLAAFPIVGVGSVCRRQHTSEIGDILRAILATDPGLPLHGFGVKTLGLAEYGHLLTTADSLAWSFRARHADPLPGHSHRKCVSCQEFAFGWRRNVTGSTYCTHHQAEYCPGWVGPHAHLFGHNHEEDTAA